MTWSASPCSFMTMAHVKIKSHSKDAIIKFEKKVNEIPSNHSPKFAPVLDPTLRTGLETMLCAAEAWFSSAVNE